MSTNPGGHALPVSPGAGRRTRRRLSAVLAVLAMLATVGLLPGSAQSASAEDPSDGQGTTKFAPPNSGGADTGGAPSLLSTIDVNGGYVAAGVGLRNRGFGTISLSGVPVGATVTKAYLYWAVLNSTETTALKTGKFKGTTITGTKVGQGASPCWTQVSAGFSYRADVTSLVTGNGSYALTGFASGRTDAAQPSGTDPGPLAEGASLVVVYSKSSYPATRVKLYNGYHMTTSTSNAASLSINWGFAASNPVGEVRTTFIGADGQTSAEPATTFNGTAFSSVDWDGTDPPLPRYTIGNLWDTDTISAGRYVNPGNTAATVKVSGGPDCLVWVAQAFSIGVNGAADTDGDKLLDGWEANGYDANGDKIIDVNLPAYPFSASVVHKDLYVEMDYMGAEATCPCHLPLASDLARIVNVFASAPYANNPDGLTGIRLHLDAGSARGAAYNMGGGNLVPHDHDLNPVETEFNAIRSAHFNAAKRAKIFYYMIWAHGYNGGSSSGNAFAIPNDRFVVTLGLWGNHGSSDEKVGTFVHEFGHTLGLYHGGYDNTNYKPNYLSVMNYGFQVSGIPRTGTTAPDFGFSRFDYPDLIETSLNEASGLGSSMASTYRTRWWCPNGTLRFTSAGANSNIDWNCSGAINSGTVSVDINKDGVKNTLTSRNDWGTLVYGGGLVGAGSSAGMEASVPAPTDELTYEESQRHRGHNH
jgi:hypothetical protein